MEMMLVNFKRSYDLLSSEVLNCDLKYLPVFAPFTRLYFCLNWMRQE